MLTIMKKIFLIAFIFPFLNLTGQKFNYVMQCISKDKKVSNTYFLVDPSHKSQLYISTFKNDLEAIMWTEDFKTHIFSVKENDNLYNFSYKY